MQLIRALEAAIEGRAVLFLGAGFSIGATNLKGRSMQTAGGLAASLAAACGLPDDAPLEDAAETYVEKCGTDELIHLLRAEFTATEVAAYHKIVASLPWKAVYTTNYDNVMEAACRTLARPLFPVTASDRVREVSKKDPLCVHLCGFAETVTRSDLFSSLKLTDTSFLSASLAASPWTAKLRDDIRLADAVFFLGYSLRDIDIRRVLYESPHLRDKCFFVVGRSPDPITTNRLARFGTVIGRSTEAFSKGVSAVKATYVVRDNPEPRLSSLSEFHLVPAKTRIEDQDSLQLLLRGDWDRSCIAASLQDGQPYYVARSESTKEALRAFEQGSRVVVVCGELGNGKTLFLEGLRHAAVEQGYRVFDVRELTREIDHELEYVATLPGKVLLTVDNYPDWLDHIRVFSQRSSDQARIVAAARTALNDVTIDALCQAADVDDAHELYVDTLSDDEVDSLASLLDTYGLWGDRAGDDWPQKLDFLARDCRGQFQAVLLKLLKSPDIRARFSDLFSRTTNPEHAKVICAVLVLTVFDFWPNIDALADLCGTDVIRKTAFKRDPAVAQFLDLRTHNVLLRSSVVAQYVLRYVIDVSTTIETLTGMAHRADALRDVSERHDKLLIALLRFSTIQLVLPSENRSDAIIAYYESLKNLPSCRDNALFWLQYAIASLAVGSLDRAGLYFETAYGLAKKSSFDTFQIDNHFARYLLMRMLVDSKFDEQAFRRASDVIRRQSQDERLHYPFRVASLYRELVDHFAFRIEAKALRSIDVEARYVLGRIEKLPDARKEQRYVRSCKADMHYVLRKLRPLLESEAPHAASEDLGKQV